MKKSSSNPSPTEFIRALDSMRQGILQGASSNGQVSEKLKEEATFRPRLLAQQILMSKQLKEQLSSLPFNIMHTVSLGYQPTAPVELVPQNHVTIKDLMSHIGTAWLGKYFICRTIVWPMKQNAVQLVVEDTTETKAIVLSLYNCFLEEDFDPQALPRGTTIIIKNPWLKVAGSGTLAIRVDNPAEVEINNKELYDGWGRLDVTINNSLGEESPKPSSDYKEKGNNYFRLRKFHSAIRSYTLGIAADPESCTLYTNRGICFLNTGRPLEAIKDAQKALVLEPGNPKAIWRKCVGMARLNRHNDALEFLKSHATIVTENSDLSTLQESLMKFYFDRNYGKYEDLAAEAEDVPIGTHLNYMEYKGPIQIVEISGKGRGMLLTSDVKKGDILIASRAFEIITEDDIGNGGKETVINANVAASILTKPTCQRLIVSIAHRLKNRAELCGILYQLYGGPKFLSLDPNSKAKDQTEYLVDMERIEGICNYNGFGEGGFPSLQKNENSRKIWSGLWILPSFINHSCTDTNADVGIHGDFMFVVAQKDLSSGTELLISYFETKNVRYKERKKKIDRYAFTCTCRLCARKR